MKTYKNRGSIDNPELDEDWLIKLDGYLKYGKYFSYEEEKKNRNMKFTPEELEERKKKAMFDMDHAKHLKATKSMNKEKLEENYKKSKEEWYNERSKNNQTMDGTHEFILSKMNTFPPISS
jgi:hypothetical protein